ncbi:hypothetical protein ACOME3_010338 [Neoechinorhynchus agilis]
MILNGSDTISSPIALGQTIPADLTESYNEIKNSNVGESRFATFLIDFIAKETSDVELNEVEAVMKNRCNEPAIVQLWRPTLCILSSFLTKKHANPDKSRVCECIFRIGLIAVDSQGWSVLDKLFNIIEEKRLTATDKSLMFAVIQSILLRIDYPLNDEINGRLQSKIQCLIKTSTSVLDLYGLCELCFRISERFDITCDITKVAIDHLLGWCLEGIEPDRGFRVLKMISPRLLYSLTEYASDYVTNTIMCRTLAAVELHLQTLQDAPFNVDTLCCLLRILEWVCLSVFNPIDHDTALTIIRVLFHGSMTLRRYEIRVWRVVNEFLFRLSESLNIPISQRFSHLVEFLEIIL